MYGERKQDSFSHIIATNDSQKKLFHSSHFLSSQFLIFSIRKKKLSPETFSFTLYFEIKSNWHGRLQNPILAQAKLSFRNRLRHRLFLEHTANQILAIFNQTTAFDAPMDLRLFRYRLAMNDTKSWSFPYWFSANQHWPFNITTFLTVLLIGNKTILEDWMANMSVLRL